VIITVTQEHINRGDPRHSERCAVALAMADAGLENPSATESTLIWWDDKATLNREVPTPSEAARFMRRGRHYRLRHLARPFTFELEAT
jgi:hypothetical protein